MQKLILWDIDGTILVNKKSHNFPLEFARAVSEAIGREVPVLDRVDGMTDFSIIHRVLEEAGLSRAEADSVFLPALWSLEKITTDKEEILATRDPARGVKKALENLSPFLQTYSTGNTPARARAKLQAFDLDHMLDAEIGGFGWWTARRADFVERAILLSQEKNGEALPVVIGDTPADIISAKEAGAFSVGVAGSIYSLEDLSEHDPDLLISDFCGDELENFISSL